MGVEAGACGGVYTALVTDRVGVVFRGADAAACVLGLQRAIYVTIRGLECTAEQIGLTASDVVAGYRAVCRSVPRE